MPGWWRLRVNRPVMAMLALIGMALIGGVLLILSTLRSERDLRVLIRNDAAVLSALQATRNALVDAETGQRGHYITLDERYLKPFDDSRKRLTEALAQLDDMSKLSTDPEVVNRLAELQLVARERMRDLEDTVAAQRRNDTAAAQDRMVNGGGLATMDHLRAMIGGIDEMVSEDMAGASDTVANAEAQMVPLLLALLAVIVVAIWLAVRLALRTADAEARAAQATELAHARDRADLLARELNHRVKNLFAVTLAIVQMSARGEAAARPVIERIQARITALLRSHELTQGGGSPGGTVAGRPLASLIETVLAPHRDDDRPCMLDGPEIILPDSAMVPLGLVLHELATNAVKYGAWSAPGGRLSVEWSLQGSTAAPRLRIAWREHAARTVIDPGDRKGFGSVLLTGTMRQLHGSFTRTFHDNGMELVLDLPFEG